MKKLMLLLVVAIMVTPVMADVEFSGVFTAPDTVTISYNCTGDPVEEPRGLALKLTCTGDVVILGGAGTDVAYNCFLDYAYSNDPYALEDGHPFADPDNPGAVDVSSGVTEVSVCMGALDEDGDETKGEPGPSAAVVIVLVVDPGAGGGTIEVRPDTLRGPDSGVVGSELASNISEAAPLIIDVGDEEPPCLTPETAIHPVGHPRAGQSYYDEWVLVGSPECWCYARQCWGDAAGDRTGSLFTGYTWVGLTDLDIFAVAWNVLEPTKGPGIATIPNGICADFNHDQTGSLFTGYTRVGLTDLTVFAASWNVLEPTKGPGIPGDCGGLLALDP